MILPVVAFNAKAVGADALKKLGFPAPAHVRTEALGNSRQHRVTYKGLEIVVQEDKTYFRFRNLASNAARRALYDKGVVPKRPADAKRIIEAKAKEAAEKLMKGASKWSMSSRGFGEVRVSRMFNEAWNTAAVRYYQNAYGYKTNGCGNSIQLDFDLGTLQVSAATMNSGWTYRKPNVKIAKAKAIALGSAALRATAAPKTIALIYVLPTWAFGVDKRRKSRECVLGYELIWDRGMAVVDAETGELIGGAKFM